MLQFSDCRNHPIDATCAIHEENRKNCEKLVPAKKSNSSFNSEGICRDFSLDTNEFKQFLLQRPCRGEFLDCDSEKITREDIDDLFPKRDISNGSNNKRPFTDNTTSSEPVKKFVLRTGTVHNKCPVNAVPVIPSPVPSSSLNSIHPNDQINTRRLPSVQQQNNQLIPSPSSSSNHTPLFDYNRQTQSNPPRDRNPFVSAREELERQRALKNTGQSSSSATPLFDYGKSTKTLGTRRSVNSKFVPPITPVNVQQTYGNSGSSGGSDSDIDPRLKNIDPKMIEFIQNEIMHQSSNVGEETVSFNTLTSLVLTIYSSTQLQIGMT